MPIAIRAILTALVAVTLAFITGLWLPNEARAPSEAPPALIKNTPPQTPATTSTPVLPEPEKISPAKSTLPKTSSAQKPPPAQAPPAPPQQTAPVQTIVNSIAQNLATTSATSSPLSLTDMVRTAVVNIICTTKVSGPLESISASGVIVDPRGIILTNSHVAQYFLLKDYPTPDFVQCIIRSGSPAYPRYTAELLFMPPSWIAKNAYKINQQNPTGNGEHDYAFLFITGMVSADIKMPSVFSSLPISVAPPSGAQKVLLAAYPAGFLGGITIAANLYSVSSYASIGDLYTFGSGSLDLFSVGGTIVSQKGSSGGAVADTDGALLGLIVTATEAPDTASRDLRAISTSYIIDDFQKESGISLSAFLGRDVVAEAHAFNLGIAPTLTQQLINAIQHP